MSKPKIVAQCLSSHVACYSAEHRCFMGLYEKILSVAEDVFGHRDKARHRLGKPVHPLGGQAPSTHLAIPLGYSDVYDALMRIDHGICT